MKHLKPISIASVIVLGLSSIFHCYMKKDFTNRLQEYESQNKPIVATVLKESYENTLSPVDKWEGVVSYSNETIKLDSKYTLKCKVTKEYTDQLPIIDGGTSGDYIFSLSIIDGGNVIKESIDQLIDTAVTPRPRISFPRGTATKKPTYWSTNLKKDNKETDFTESPQAGTKRAHRIKVLNLK